MNLKTRNTTLLIGFVLLNLIIFFAVHGFPWIELTRLSEGLDIQSPLLAIALHLGVLVLNYFLPEAIKNTVVYWRTNNPLPGTRAFSELGPKDPRINMAELEAQYGTLPTEPLEQNRLWYKIYRGKETDTVVSSSHSRWLLTRDISTIAFELMVLLSIISLVRSIALPSICYSLFLVVQYLLFAIVGQNAGDRFVCNVLAR